MKELQVVDGKKWVENHPERFFRAGTASGVELAGHALCDIVHQGHECRVSRVGDWWVVACDLNWMAAPELPLDALFSRVVPAPEQGPNSMRAEVIFSAFARNVAVYTDSAWHVVCGRIDNTIKDHIRASIAGTVLVFQV